jgi:hypothetical protein
MCQCRALGNGSGAPAASGPSDGSGASGGSRSSTGGSGNNGGTLSSNATGGSTSHTTGGSTGATGGSTGATGASAGAFGSGGLSASGDGTLLSSGTQKLVDLFVTDAGILLIFTDEIRLVSRAGNTLQSLPSAREITAAAYESDTLVVVDKAKFTSYDAALETIVSADLATGCSSAVLIGGGRFVCGQDVDWDRVYYTYDVKSGDLVASSMQYTYDGLPMRRVPGQDMFVAVEVASSPANLFLYQVGDDGAATLLGSSSFETSDPTNVYTFFGDPATDVVAQDGAILAIPGDCTGTAFNEGCFTQHGELGTLTGSQVFIGMDSDSAGQLYALVDLSPSFSAPCSSGCTVQQIDVASRSVTRQAVRSLGTIGSVVGVRYDAAADALVAGCSTANRFGSPTTAEGHRVLSLALGTSN